ncbi:AMP-binding protein [Streptomyces formicae]
MNALTCSTLGEAVQALPPEVSVTYPHSGERLDATALDRASARFARRLIDSGVRPGEVVGLLAPTCPEVLVCLMGIVRAGAAASLLPSAPGEPSSTAERLAPAVEAAGMQHLVTHRECADAARALRERCPGLTAVDAHAGTLGGTSPVTEESLPVTEEPLPPVSADDLAVVQFTSGSTSAPKGVMLPHSTVLAGLRAIVDSARITSEDVMVTWVPHFHDMGLFGPLAVLLAGGSVYAVPPLEFVRRPGKVLGLLAETGGTMLTGPDFSYRRLAAAATPEVTADLDLSRWRLAFNGAEPVRAATVDAFRTRTAPAHAPASTMYPVYGMAEATLAVAFPVPGTEARVVHLDSAHLADHHRALPVSPDHPRAKALVSVGQPVAGLSLRLVDDTGEVCGPGELGEIQICGPAVTTGYFRDPAATAEVFDGPWLRTGDLGLQLDGDLFVTGRRKEMIIVNGQNHFPEDVEALARRQPGVHQKRCIAFSDHAGERLAVAAEIAPDCDPETVAAHIHRAITDRLGLAAVRVHPVAPGWLPRTTSGKWQRGRVRELLAEHALPR